jgi:polar amino acid transport system permease protein
MTFDIDYALAILPQLVAAARVTVIATIGGFAIAAVLGIFLALARLSPARAVAGPTAVGVEFLRTTPLLVQLFFAFYVLPRVGLRFEALTTGMVVLGLHYSTYTSEVYRAGIQNLPRHQWEAAVALNLTPTSTWTRVILPQAIPPVIPVLANYLIGMFKETPMLATITVQELLGTALAEAGRTFRYFEPITIVGLVFLILSIPASMAARYLESRMALRRQGSGR